MSSCCIYFMIIDIHLTSCWHSDRTYLMSMVTEILAFNHSVLSWVKKRSVYEYYLDYCIFFTLFGFLEEDGEDKKIWDIHRHATQLIVVFPKTSFLSLIPDLKWNHVEHVSKKDLKYCLTCTVMFLIGILALC